VAIRAQAPVVPVAIVGTYDLLPINSFHVMPGDVILAIGEPIPTAGMRLRDMDKLSSQVRQAIAEMYDSRTKRLAPVSASDERKAKPMLTPES
jgi:1-acyl-sn-glycerol-3-phosphate acyltransferase